LSLQQSQQANNPAPQERTLTIMRNAMPWWSLTEKLTHGPRHGLPTAALPGSSRERDSVGKVGFFASFISRIALHRDTRQTRRRPVSRFSDLFLFVFGKAGMNKRLARDVK